MGKTISFDKRFEKEIEERISKAWKSFWSLKARPSVISGLKLGIYLATSEKAKFNTVSYKRKKLEFQMLAAVYHKGDHGQYCYTLK